MTPQGGLGGCRQGIREGIREIRPHTESPRNHWFLHRILTIPPQNRALASVLATFPTSDSSESCSRHSPGHISHIRLSRSQRNHWFLLRILAIPPQNRALALVLGTFPTPDSSESHWFLHSILTQSLQNHAVALVLATFRTSGSQNHWFLHRILAIPLQNRALALVLGTFPTPDSSDHFRHQTHQNHVFSTAVFGSGCVSHVPVPARS